MSPADVAAAFEDAALATALACVVGALVIGLWVKWEWAVSKAHRDQRNPLRRVE